MKATLARATPAGIGRTSVWKFARSPGPSVATGGRKCQRRTSCPALVSRLPCIVGIARTSLLVLITTPWMMSPSFLRTGSTSAICKPSALTAAAGGCAVAGATDGAAAGAGAGAIEGAGDVGAGATDGAEDEGADRLGNPPPPVTPAAEGSAGVGSAAAGDSVATGQVR